MNVTWISLAAFWLNAAVTVHGTNVEDYERASAFYGRHNMDSTDEHSYVDMDVTSRRLKQKKKAKKKSKQQKQAARIALLEAEILDLKATIEKLNSTECFTSDYVEARVLDSLVENNAFGDWAAATPKQDQTVARLTNGGNAIAYDTAGFPLYYDYNPEAQFFLSNSGDDTLVKDMVGEVFKFPEEGNTADEVEFDLPPIPAYEKPSDLYYMPILEMAALIKSGTVSCVELVTAFIDRLKEFDPYLGIVATPLYDKALEIAAEHDAYLAQDIYKGPLMCIPFGLKDHHQVFDDDPTMYGHLLHAANVQSVKSTTTTKLLEAGAIPIAKMQLGTYAWSSANGWGECMSPYLNGPGCGSSCGSGSGAALGALPFAVSEETSGSIACPASANLISGHIGSYGSLSRAGAGLLCSETDHLGFHSRYLKDFGVIFNYARSGVDPLDGDTVEQKFMDPAKVDVTKLKVMIIEGFGKWVYNNETDSYSWDNTVKQSYGKSAWHWPERVEKIKARLTDAGVPWESFSSDEANGLWSFNSTSTPYFSCASPRINVMMAAGPWAQLQECEYCFVNAKWKTYTPRNVPKKSYRYLQYCMKTMGKYFLNDDVWKEYDVIINTRSYQGGDYDIPGSSFEQWVRTAKTFVMDYYEALPCATKSGDAIEGVYATLTALPFEDYKNFAIGSIIQDTDAIMFPVDEAIKKAFTGRTRCPFSFYEEYNDMTETCPPLNGPGGPPGPSLRGMDVACDPESSRHHIPFDWANETYVAPYEMDEKVPDRALYRWDEYEPVACTAVCPFVQSFCDLKGIVCDARRLAEEKERKVPDINGLPHRRMTETERRLAVTEFEDELEHGGEL